ncbi:Helix-turn-helix domain-containing protein [Catalinimonas alkaloidigena]|uniref:Helix-turn-helix domain-containing protein n=1 Tax=Catalinimonas alkaloidigena TaxID=1075417 RepID=A0A1G9VLS1_9BACT|nr:AraC family transcriptional regulator [Catalinimonas alkaloidigena]SDM73144.1 Helix-turn-helix domain-containing protein [Catalinimonas alkaloidigena]
MPIERLAIKNMVCPRCIKVVYHVLEQCGAKVYEVQLGQAEVDSLDLTTVECIRVALQKEGFELLEQRSDVVAECVKSCLIALVYSDELPTKLSRKLSSYLAEQLQEDYARLRASFHESEGIHINQYFIELKIERVKELLSYRELNLTQIARLLGYSSIGHLSAQFRKVTGLSPRQYQKLSNPPRRSPGEIGLNSKA